MKHTKINIKKLSSIILILFSLQSWTKADDIRDFQIEGISLGDSLLDYHSETEIKNPEKNNIYFYPKSKKFYEIVLNTKSDIYDEIQFSLKDKDSTYKIYNINGTIYFNQNINKCYKMQDEIEADLNSIFDMNNIKTSQDKGKHQVDPSGKSTYKAKWFLFNSGSYVAILCTDYHKDMKLEDSLKLLISSKIYNDFLTNEAY